jgi:hypothetical protein
MHLVFNKIKETVTIVDNSALNDIKRQVDEINRVYKNPENVYSDMTVDWCQDSVSLNNSRSTL